MRALGDGPLIIRGHFVADAPYFAVHLRLEWFEGTSWLLADTGAARTTLLDRDIRHLGIPLEALGRRRYPLLESEGASVHSFYGMWR